MADERPTRSLTAAERAEVAGLAGLSDEEQEVVLLPVMAQLGRALAAAQTLEMTVTARVLQVELEQKAPAPGSDDFSRALEEMFSQTLGRQLSRLRDALPETEDQSYWTEILDMRNSLVHHYWRARFHLLFTAAGREAVQRELLDWRSAFVEAYERLQEEAWRDLAAAGFGPEWLVRRLAEGGARP